MRKLACLLISAALAAGAAAKTASSPAGDAAAARELLGSAAWARIIRIENARPAGLLSRGSYPGVVYGVVFEMRGILWFYTGTDGTQSLSLRRGTTERDEADPGPLLRQIDPGFQSWSWVDEARLPRPPASYRPPNACFIESVAALRRRLSLGERSDFPSLLSYYVTTRAGVLGHTVLLFSSEAGLMALDTEVSDRPVPVPTEVGTDPRRVSSYLRGGPVTSARLLPMGGERPGKVPQWAADTTPSRAAG